MQMAQWRSASDCSDYLHTAKSFCIIPLPHIALASFPLQENFITKNSLMSERFIWCMLLLC